MRVLELCPALGRDGLIESAASVAHEVNRAYCKAMGDDSQPPWSRATKWQRDSCIARVMFHVAHPQVGPSGSHENWMRFKLADGWTYGPVKDPDAKTHPCLVPFGELPKEQQVKDHLFHAVVHGMLNGGIHGEVPEKPLPKIEAAEAAKLYRYRPGDGADAEDASHDLAKASPIERAEYEAMKAAGARFYWTEYLGAAGEFVRVERSSFQFVADMAGIEVQVIEERA